MCLRGDARGRYKEWGGGAVTRHVTRTMAPRLTADERRLVGRGVSHPCVPMTMTTTTTAHVDDDATHHHHARTLPLRDVLSLPITSPPIQRAIDEGRVDAIVGAHLDRVRRGLPPVFLGALQVVPHGGGAYALLDGQHRLAAMRRLAAAAEAEEEEVLATLVLDAPVHLEIIPLDRLGMTQMEAFQTINKGVPVPEYVVRGAMDRERRDALDDFKRRFAASEFAGFLSPARAPRRPNINLEQFVDRVAREAVLVDACAGTGDALMAYVRWANARLRALLKDDAGGGRGGGGGGDDGMTSVLHRATDKARRLRVGADAAFVLTADERWMSAAWVADYAQTASAASAAAAAAALAAQRRAAPPT